MHHRPPSTVHRPPPTRRVLAALSACVWLALQLGGCGTSQPPRATLPTATLAPLLGRDARPQATPLPQADLTVRVDAAANRHPISPLIYGLSGAPPALLHALRPALNSWGGNTSSRYNWQLGNAWNAGRDWFYRNGNYGLQSGSASDQFVANSRAAGAAVRLAVPTLGWVAKNDDNATCSFPLPDGGCGDAGLASCRAPGQVADPQRANQPSDVPFVTAWVQHLLRDDQAAVRFIAMDNEPELWGITHYDVHPTCTSSREILDHYLRYASAVRQVAPHAELLGPVTCCWDFYWNTDAGLTDRLARGGQDFLPWFLAEVRRHDQANRTVTLDVLDIHYYPAGLYNDQADPQTAARRLRATRALWDRSYRDESYINQPIWLIPQMHALIEAHYPGRKLAISEWNFGADQTVNGALAIADVLGIFGREGLYLASYWRYPALNSPGFYAFKLYSNYDGQGSRFGDTSVLADSSLPELVTAYAATDSAKKRLTLMLINKDPERQLTANLTLAHYRASQASLYRYSQAQPTAISQASLPESPPAQLLLPPYSMTLLVLEE